jgi:hypothetical protein
MNNHEIHYRYAISYLIFIIIGISSLCLFDVPNLVDKLSFALSLSSLLLAILAIFYTIISANKQDEQFLKSTETQLDIKFSSRELREASARINELISEVPNHFNKIDKKLDSIYEKYETVQVDKHEKIENNTIDPELNIDKQTLHKMIIRLQYTAIGVLYFFTESYRNDTNIEFYMFKKFNLISEDYAVGVLNGFETTGLIDFNIDYNTASIVPTKCNQIILDEILIIAEGVLKVTNDLSTKNRFKSMLNDIKNLNA